MNRVPRLMEVWTDLRPTARLRKTAPGCWPMEAGSSWNLGKAKPRRSAHCYGKVDWQLKTRPDATFQALTAPSSQARHDYGALRTREKTSWIIRTERLAFSNGIDPTEVALLRPGAKALCEAAMQTRADEQPKTAAKSPDRVRMLQRFAHDVSGRKLIARYQR